MLIGISVSSAQNQNISNQNQYEKMAYADNPKDKLAIVIGVNKYDNMPWLNYAVQDAKDIRDILEDKGNFNVIYIADDSNIEPTQKNITNFLQLALSNAEAGLLDTFIFYFAGHGFHMDGVNYLSPRDIKISSDKYRKDTAICEDTIKNTVHKMNVKCMLFFDACRNEPNRGDKDEAWIMDNDDSGLKILYSTSPKQSSYEEPDFENGVFTEYLLKGLNGEADINDNDYVSFYEIAKYMIQELSRWTINNPDKPQIPTVTIELKDNISMDEWNITNVSDEYVSVKPGDEIPADDNDEDSETIDNDSHGIGILYAASPYENAMEDDELEHGVFTYYFSEGISGNADYNNDEYVTFNEISRYVFYNVKEYIRENHSRMGKQLPSLEIIDQYGNFIITELNNKNELNSNDRLAIVIGINEYDSYRFPKLKYCVKDTKLIKDILEKKGGFDVQCYSDDDIDPNRENIINAVKEAVYAINKGWIKTMVLYYSGHGGRIGGKDIINPNDVKYNNSNIDKETVIFLDDILKIIDEVKNKAEIMIFLDTSRIDR
jgi:uncharacterized caspase-like protein